TTRLNQSLSMCCDSLSLDYAALRYHGRRRLPEEGVDGYIGRASEERALGKESVARMDHRRPGRNRGGDDGVRIEVARNRQDLVGIGHMPRLFVAGGIDPDGPNPEFAGRLKDATGDLRDRKSTRLNSSHVKISY